MLYFHFSQCEASLFSIARMISKACYYGLVLLGWSSLLGKPMQAWDDQGRQLEGQRLISMGPKAIEAAIWLNNEFFIHTVFEQTVWLHTITIKSNLGDYSLSMEVFFFQDLPCFTLSLFVVWTRHTLHSTSLKPLTGWMNPHCVWTNCLVVRRTIRNHFNEAKWGPAWLECTQIYTICTAHVSIIQKQTIWDIFSVVIEWTQCTRYIKLPDWWTLKSSVVIFCKFLSRHVSFQDKCWKKKSSNVKKLLTVLQKKSEIENVAQILLGRCLD